MSSAGYGSPGPESSGRPGFAGQPPADSATGASDTPEFADEQVGVAEEVFAEQQGVPASDLSARTGSGGEEAERFPPEGGGEAGSPAEAVPGDPVATAVAVVAKERDDYREALQRLQADFENYKKRVTKQQEELRDRAAESLVEKLLPVLDTADLALTHGAGEDVKQMAGSLFSALEREGLERIDNAGEPFDPNHHDAVAHEPGDGPTQEVAEVMRAGYRWRGRVLRAAMVKVRG